MIFILYIYPIFRVSSTAVQAPTTDATEAAIGQDQTEAPEPPQATTGQDQTDTTPAASGQDPDESALAAYGPDSIEAPSDRTDQADASQARPNM